MNVYFDREEFEGKSKEELQDKLNKYIEAGLVPPATTLDDVGIWDSPEYCLKKLIKSIYGREDYLVDTVTAISASECKPEDNIENKKFDRAVQQVALLMKKLASEQYLERRGIKYGSN